MTEKSPASNSTADAGKMSKNVSTKAPAAAAETLPKKPASRATASEKTPPQPAPATKTSSVKSPEKKTPTLKNAAVTTTTSVKQETTKKEASTVKESKKLEKESERMKKESKKSTKGSKKSKKSRKKSKKSTKTAATAAAEPVAVEEEEPADDEEEVKPDEETPDLKVGEIIDDQFKIVTILGQGGFGAVFEVFDQRTKQHRAMKIELQTPDPDEAGLALEVGVLRRMQRSRHFPKFVHSGVYKKLTYMVMQMCGDNLWYLVRKCRRKRFTLSTVAQLSLQSLQAIRELHHAELLHRDIKPENFLMGRGPADKRTVYLLDFGLVRRYKFKGKIRPARPVAAFRGTFVYASPRILSNQDAGRCDDLMSWLYVMLELLKSTLPWSDVDMTRKKLYEFKIASVKDLLADVPHEFTQIHSEINRLGYADSPPYGKIRRLIRQMMLNGKVKETDPLDFEPGGSEYEAVFVKIEQRRTVVKRKRMAEVERRQSRNDDITMRSFHFQ